MAKLQYTKRKFSLAFPYEWREYEREGLVHVQTYLVFSRIEVLLLFLQQSRQRRLPLER